MSCLFSFQCFVVLLFSVLEIDCGKPLLIPHTTMTWDNSTTLWSRVYYHCKEGYYFNGDRNFSECTIDQSWENITYVCKGKYYHTKLLFKLQFNLFVTPVLKLGAGGRMRARNPFLVYDVGNVVVLLDGEVTEESAYNAATSTGCHRSSVAVLLFFSNRNVTFFLKQANATGVLLPQTVPSASEAHGVSPEGQKAFNNIFLLL